MMITWSELNSVPLPQISHQFGPISADKVNIISRNLSCLPQSHTPGPAQIDDLMFRLFLSRVMRFEGQKIDIEDGLIHAGIACTGEAFASIRFVETMLSILSDPKFDAERSRSVVQNLSQLMADKSVGAKSNQYALAAFYRGYDLIKKDPASECLEVRDVNGQRMTLMKSFTDRTSFIATKMSTKKDWTMQVLRISGLPVPRTEVVRSERDAVEFWKGGLPLASVIKPAATDYGTAVSTELKSAGQVAEAFRIASQHGSVIGQEHVAGEDYRILVVDGVVAGVTRRRPFHVVGDGKKTVRELARDKMADRSKHPFYRRYNDIDLNSDEIGLALKRQSVGLDDILPADRYLKLRYNSNVSSGGEHEDVTDICHPANLQLGLDAANVVGLDVAGIDLLSRDIARPWSENGAKICEINPTPAVSTSNAPGLLLRRLGEARHEGRAGPAVGDHLYINCTPRSDDRGSKQLSGVRGQQNLDLLTMEQYFHQSYLCKTMASCDLYVSLQRLLALGCPNKNVTAAYCKGAEDISEEVMRKLRERLPLNTSLIITGGGIN